MPPAPPPSLSAGAPPLHSPGWSDPVAVDAVTADLSTRSGLVTYPDVIALRERIGAAVAGDAVVIQAGECAELFAQAHHDDIAARVQALRVVAEELARSSDREVISIARMAGQYAKARSSATEHRDGVDLPSYRGDMINGAAFEAHERRPDPGRMAAAYDAAAATIAELARISPGLPTAHEALVLDYEKALVRQGADGRGYGSSGHFLWVGERTRQLDGPHVDFLSQIANPVGVKLGPTISVEEVLALATRLDPERIPGRLSLITRMGAGVLARRLPGLVAALARAGHPVAWMCDPMHANTILVDGIKTRRVRDICAEVETFLGVMREAEVSPAGIHLELAGSMVTECLGGAPEVARGDLPARYTTACDPRLNQSQAQLVIASTSWA